MPKLRPDRPRQLTAVGCHIYAGGFTLGVARAGFDVLAVLEEGPYGVATSLRNQPDVSVYVGNANWPLDDLEQRDVDFVFGNPPCAAWSQVGRVVTGGDWRDDDRVDCTRRHFELLERLRPRVWVWESVCNAFTKGREFVDELTVRALDLGYSVTYLLHDGQYLGVPQSRKRFFFVAHRVVFCPTVPSWKTTTVGEALAGMSGPGEEDVRMAPHLEALYPTLRQGGSLRQAWEAAAGDESRWERSPDGSKVLGRPAIAIYREWLDRPGHTVAGYPVVHPTEDRCLTTKELQVLNGYPEDYEFVGSGRSGLIARGVCPPTAEWLAREVSAAVLADEPNSGCVTLVDYRSPPGSVQKLPKPGSVAAPVVVLAGPRFSPKRRPGVLTETRTQRLKTGSGAYIRELLAAGVPDDEIVRLNKERFPESRAGKGDVAWNRRKMTLDSLRGGATVPRLRPDIVATEPETRTADDDLPSDAPQPTRSKRTREERRFDQTALTEKTHGYRVHRDYASHFFRWGFAARMVDGTMDVLDVGCGVDCPFVKVLAGGYPAGVPRSYVGVDMNPLKKPPQRPWATWHGEFDFTARHAELGQFDVVMNFEVIEHMAPRDGLQLLVGMRECLRPDGTLLLSTPVFDGKAALNHVHEYTVDELSKMVARAGLRVEKRFGTFANYRAIKKVATPEQVETLDSLNEFYSSDVTACFLAPLYPDASRNNVWVLKKSKK